MALGGLGAKDILIQLKGDNKDFKNAMSDSDKSMGSLVGSVKKYGPAMAAAFAVGTAALVASSIKMAAAEEVVNRQTESMLKSQGVMWGSVKGEVTDYINELEKLTAYGDTDLQMAFNRMISSGMSYTEAMESMKMVTDIAYTRNIDLVASADLVSKAYNGQGSALKRYGIDIGNVVSGSEALIAVNAEVDASFADATDRTDTLEGKVESLNNTFDDTKEALGAELIPEVTAFTDALVGAGGGAEELGTLLGRIITMPIKLPRLAGEHAANMITINKLRKEGIDTEDEFIHKFQLSGEELVNMTEEQFKYATAILTAAGYHERVLKLEKARVYGTNMQNRAKQEQLDLDAQLLAAEEALTAEGDKQLSSMRERARLANAAIQAKPGRGGFAGVSAEEMRGLRQTEDVKVGYKRQSGKWTVTGGNQSGAP